MRPPTYFIFLLLLLLLSTSISNGFTCSMSGKPIYDVENSGWKSPQWNWGYGVGTGHVCAAICRKKYRTRQSRSELVQDLLRDVPTRDRQPKNFEEVKLILALAWQRGRWDGTDGGQRGYGDVLAAMADARRYEDGSEEECSIRLVEDMQSRYKLLDPETDDQSLMDGIFEYSNDDYDTARRICSGLVLKSMGFIESGL